MTIHIGCNDKVILRLRNMLFYILHQNIQSIVHENNIMLSDNLKSMIDEMDQEDKWGMINVDIENYIKSKNDLIVFLNVLEKAISVCKEKGFLEDAIRALWQFHAEIVKYGETLDK